MNRLNRVYERLYGGRRTIGHSLYGLVAALGYGAAYLLRFEFALAAESGKAGSA